MDKFLDREWSDNTRENANKTLQGIKTNQSRWRPTVFIFCENANKTLQGIKTNKCWSCPALRSGENANKTLQGIKTDTKTLRSTLDEMVKTLIKPCKGLKRMIAEYGFRYDDQVKTLIKPCKGLKRYPFYPNKDFSGEWKR